MFKWLGLALLKAPILKYFLFWSRNATEILKKAHNNSITWQKVKIFKIFLMITLVFKKDLQKGVKNRIFGKLPETCQYMFKFIYGTKLFLQYNKNALQKQGLRFVDKFHIQWENFFLAVPAPKFFWNIFYWCC